MKYILFLCVAMLIAAQAYSSDVFQWHSSSVTGLYGAGFEVDPEVQATLTLEHANGWRWGDFYGFIDWIHYVDESNYKGDDMSYYGELSPRFSAGKILNTDLSLYFIKDWLVATTFEFGDNDVENYLIGPAVDINVPAFDFFQLNLYRRFNSGESDIQSYQLTPVWKLTAPLGGTTVVFDGFIDWVFGDGTDNIHVCPQLKFDIGVYLGLGSLSLLAGIEYDYWYNKYGIQDAPEQHAVSAILQYHL